MRRRWRSNSPRARKSANVSWSIIGEPRSASSLASANGSTSRRGSTSQPRRKAGREGLARRARVGDPVGLEALHGADRGAVVAVLGVVVVLDHERPGAPRPGEHRGAGLGREHAAGRPLVRGGEDQGVGVQCAPRRRRGRRRRRPARRPRRARAPRAIGRASSTADGSSTASVFAPRPASTWMSSDDRLGVAVADDDRLGVGRRAAHAVEVVGERRAQLRRAAAVEVAEALVGGLGEHPADGAQPGGPRESRARWRGRSRSRPPGRRRRRHGAARACRGRRYRPSARAPPACSRRCGSSGTPRRRAARRPRRRRPARRPARRRGRGWAAARCQPAALRTGCRSRIDASIWRCSATAPSRSELDRAAPRPATNWSSIRPRELDLIKGTDCWQSAGHDDHRAVPDHRPPLDFDGRRPHPRRPRLRRRPHRLERR